MKTILLIESDPANLVALSLMLRGLGYNVLEAVSRGQAWGVCHHHGGPIHVVMTSAILDNDTTGEFVARLRLLYPQIRAAVILSDKSQPELADKPREYALLQKPFRVDTLANTKRRLLNGPKQRAVSAVL